MNLKYMDIAFDEAKKGFKQNEVPIGAILVKNGKIIAKSHNNKEKKSCCLCHAEINVIKKASKKMKNWRLDDCEMYVTLDPCQCVLVLLNNLEFQQFILRVLILIRLILILFL